MPNIKVIGEKDDILKDNNYDLNDNNGIKLLEQKYKAQIQIYKTTIDKYKEKIKKLRKQISDEAFLNELKEHLKEREWGVEYNWQEVGKSN